MIRIKSPTRVDLAGGTLDCWPLFLFVGEASTVNLAIDIETSVELEPRDDSKIFVNITDLNWSEEFANLEALLDDQSEKGLLVREVVRYQRPNRGFSIKSASKSPVGAGLGGSSSLCISMMKALAEMEGWSWNVSEYVERAHNIEARILHKPTGKQDYVPALIGGLNHIRFATDGMSVHPMAFDSELFDRKLSLVYTGRPHHSGINNWEVIKLAMEKHKPTLSALKEIAEISDEVVRVCEKQDWASLPALLNKESETRVQLSAGFSSPEIESLRSEALSLGAEAVKICGAGGGGCVLIWGEPELHDKISELCEKSELRHLPIKAVKPLANAPALKN